MAQNGQRTLLIGANLRRPSIHRFFGIEREPGLSDVLVGNARWRDCIRTVADILMGRFEMEDIMASPGLDNLHILESGPIPANPSELLSTPAMAQLLTEVREDYDVVLIDTPPVLPVTDSAIVAAQVDGVILVYQAGKVGRLVLKRAKAHLESARAKVWGVVLNDVQTEIAGYAYTHYYTHYYGEETPGDHTPSRLERIWNTVRGRFRGDNRASTAPTVPTEQTNDLPIDMAMDAPVATGTKSRRKYRNVIGGVLLLVGLVALISALAWKAGWFGTALQPREILRKRLDAPAEANPGRDATAAPTSPTESSLPPGLVAPPSPPLAAPPAVSTQSATADESVATTPTVITSAATTPAVATPGSPPRSSAAAPVAPRRTTATPPGERFAVEFGPFPTAGEAEGVERQLIQAGHQTVRFRQQTGGALYGVLIERVPTARDAQQLVTALREQGFPEGMILGGGEPLTVRVGDPLPLHGAVQLAERVRGRGHPVRVAAQAGEAVTFVIRHGNFASRSEAEEKAEELSRLGLPNRVVRVR
ncbi:MAG: hypothetical protein DME08_11535 [Candidatus Rokuibacteriota bacterium]|nr:MAG: hypothetical protein DME08_11535 [Candidatus Rokubacteria bacterium]